MQEDSETQYSLIKEYAMKVYGEVVTYNHHFLQIYCNKFDKHVISK
jgi:hypothetical protein